MVEVYRSEVLMLTFAQAKRRCPNMVKEQMWRGTRAVYWFVCKAGFGHPRYRQIYNNHARRRRCPKCGEAQRLESRRISITKMKRQCPALIHGQQAHGNSAKYWFRCALHGKCLQNFSSHRAGRRCREMGNLAIGDALRKSVASFIRTARKVHGRAYDYSRVVYTHSKEKVLIICSHHGPFFQNPTDHLGGRGCRKCQYAALRQTLRHDIKQLEQEYPDLISGQMYKNSNTKLLWNCLAGLGHPSYRKTLNHYRKGVRCPKCMRRKGEVALEKAALMLGITDYEEQRRFPDCRATRLLPFDGASETLKTLFEFHGQQHYRSVKGWGGLKTLCAVQRRDRIKRNWARRNGWRLIVICYRIKNVEGYLRKRLL